MKLSMRFVRCFVFLFSVVTGMTAFLTNDVTFSNSMTDKSELLETVVSYKDVLHSYYRFATEDTSNPSSLSIPVFYNSTMCYDNDAKHWSNLANVRAIVSISPYGYQNVEISENWFATTIVASFFKGSHRIITYANSLNQNGTLSQYQSVL